MALLIVKGEISDILSVEVKAFCVFSLSNSSKPLLKMALLVSFITGFTLPKLGI